MRRSVASCNHSLSACEKSGRVRLVYQQAAACWLATQLVLWRREACTASTRWYAYVVDVVWNADWLLGVLREQLDGESWLITDVIALEREVGTAWLGELAWMCEGASAPSPFRAHHCVSSARSTVRGPKAGDGRRKLFNGLELGPWSPWCDLLLFIFSHLLSMILGR